MATIDEALTARLKTHAGLSGLVGARVYPVALPQDVTYPAVSYQRIGGPGRVRAMGGARSLTGIRVQIDVWAATVASMRDVCAQIKAALEGWTKASDPVVQYTILDMPIEDTEEVTRADAAGKVLYRAIHQAEIWFEE